jgi:hypothetical protein
MFAAANVEVDTFELDPCAGIMGTLAFPILMFSVAFAICVFSIGHQQRRYTPPAPVSGVEPHVVNAPLCATTSIKPEAVNRESTDGVPHVSRIMIWSSSCMWTPIIPSRAQVCPLIHVYD